MAAKQPWDLVKPPTLQSDEFVDANVGFLGGSLCWNYKMTGETLCESADDEAPVQSYNDVYFEVREWNPIDVERFIVSEENDAGERRVKYYRQKRIVSFEVVCNDFYLNLLQNFEMFQKWSIFRRDNNDEFPVQSYSIGKPSRLKNGYHTAEITLVLDDADQVIDSCCGSAYANAPYEDCTDGEGIIADPIECASYAMNALVFDAVNKTLTASTTGQPAGTTETFKWYFFKDASSPVQVLTTTAAVLNVVEYGTYRAIATAGVCQAGPEDFLYQDDCMDYAAVIAYTDGYIVLQPTMLSSVAWTLDGSPIAETGLIFKPSISGTYEATLTWEGCELVKSVVVSLADCAFNASIDVNGQVLTAIHDYVGGNPINFQWYVDTGSGLGAISGATNASYTVTEEGNYVVEITIGTCTQTVSKLMIGACYNWNVYIDHVIENGGNVEVYAGHNNAPGATDFTWYQFLGGVWSEVGTGLSIVLNNEGPVRLKAESEGCLKELYTQACIDPTKPEWQEREIATASQTIFDDLTYFTDINGPALISAMIAALDSEDDIGAEWELYRNGARLIYVHEANLNHRSQWTVDSNGDVKLFWPSNAGDVYVMVRRYIP